METEAFNKSMLALFEVCDNIQKAKEMGNLKLALGKKKLNPIMTYFRQYVEVYKKKTEPDEHIPDVVAMFKRHRHSILKGESDDWLKDKNVTLQFCDGLKETSDIRIMISAFYNNAIQVKDSLKEQLSGLPQEALEERVELVYCNVLRLHLYRLMHASVEAGPDKEALGKIVKSIEEQLGLASAETVDTTPDFNLTNIIGEAAKLAKQQGIVGPGTKMPNETDITSIFGKLFNSPAIKDTLGSLLGGLQEARTPEQLMGKLGESLKKMGPELQGLTSALVPPTPDTAAAAAPTSESAPLQLETTSAPSDGKLLLEM